MHLQLRCLKTGRIELPALLRVQKNETHITVYFHGVCLILKIRQVSIIEHQEENIRNPFEVGREQQAVLFEEVW